MGNDIIQRVVVTVSTAALLGLLAFLGRGVVPMLDQLWAHLTPLDATVLAVIWIIAVVVQVSVGAFLQKKQKEGYALRVVESLAVQMTTDPQSAATEIRRRLKLLLGWEVPPSAPGWERSIKDPIPPLASPPNPGSHLDDPKG